MAVTYDGAVLSAEAERLYSRARFAKVLYALIGVVTGAVVMRFLTRLPPEDGLAAPVLGGIFGYAYGESVGFRYKLEAQRLLVLAAIERNTRGA